MEPDEVLSGQSSGGLSFDQPVRIARRFGLEGDIVRLKTADAKVIAPRPLRGGLRVDRVVALLRNQPLSNGDAPPARIVTA